MKRKWAVVGAVLGISLLAGCGGGGSSSSSGPLPPADLVGNWGGGAALVPAALSVTATGGMLSFSCGAADTLTQPLTADAAGTFDVTATQKVVLPQAGPPATVHLTGTVQGRTMTLREVNATGPSGPVLTLTFGQAAPPFNQVCPG